VKSTTVLGPDRIKATIEVPSTAPIAIYDVEVTLTNGKKGVGAEMFAVKPRGPAPQYGVDYSITDAGLSLQSDGKGLYRDGVCGVVALYSINIALYPSNGRIPKSQKVECIGVAPRTITVTLALRHISDDPHLDETVSPSVYSVGNINVAFGPNLATIINATTNGTTICGTLGLRFTATGFPGSNHTVRDDLGGGLWHVYTSPWPDNKAYCENNGVAAFWHVSFDLYAQVLPN